MYTFIMILLAFIAGGITQELWIRFHKTAGILKWTIDEDDDMPYLYLESNKEIADIQKEEYVVFTIDNSHK